MFDTIILMAFNIIWLIIKHGFIIQNVDPPYARHPCSDARQT